MKSEDVDLIASEAQILNDVPLCVDLDGTLLGSDLLWESLAAAVRDNPLRVLLLPAALLSGRANLKRQIAKIGRVTAEHLPYNESVVEWLQKQKREGRRIVLATASDRELAESVARHLGLFDDVLASDGRFNLKGANKLRVLRERFGKTFDYVGDSSADLCIWESCRSAILVHPSSGTLRKASRRGNVLLCFDASKRNWPHLLRKQLRIHQWVKNLLVFVPLATAHQLTNWPLLADAVLMFLSFSVTASSVYIVNDIVDLAADRNDEIKRHRPLASGGMPLPFGFALAPLLLLTGILTAFLLNPLAALAVSFYFAASLAYSVRLKREPIVDVFVLACLYTLRLFAGGTAYHVSLSSWIISFSVFIFLSLGFCKRVAELLRLPGTIHGAAHRRGYFQTDLPAVSMFGAASGFCASLVVMLYVESANVRKLYQHPNRLWLLSPLILFWIIRVWMITQRGGMHHDPILFAIKDRISWVVFLMILVTAIAASVSF